MQALLPNAGHNTIVPLANRKPEHFCDLTTCISMLLTRVSLSNCVRDEHGLWVEDRQIIGI